MEKVVTIGIDPSLTNTGVVICTATEDGLTYSHCVIRPTRLRGAERLAYIMEQFSRFISRHFGVIAVIEGYNYQGQSLAELGEASGVLKAACALRGCKVLVATPSQVKKFVTGNSQATKDEMMAATGQTNDHIADAVALALIGQTYLTGKSSKRCELEVIKALKEGMKKTRSRVVPKLNGGAIRM